MEDSPHRIPADYLEKYLHDRDASATLSMFGPDATCYGTGPDEVGYDLDTLEKLYRRDIEQAPERGNYSIIRSLVRQPAENVMVALYELNISTHILRQEVKLNFLRLSLLFVRTEGKWRIEHMHISLPTTAHGEGEAYPIRELEERSKVLARLVAEKTGELQAANEELRKKIEEIKTLRGLLPICASCKKIRDEKGDWHQLEAYITKRSEAKFSHGICPECAKKLYSRDLSRG
ncbi:MAG: nuclear transport factor 2 family protein [Planctomycetota bacterium]|nr:nuclear transport factor 2 family protein [Planctomycetota bacterium]